MSEPGQMVSHWGSSDRVRDHVMACLESAFIRLAGSDSTSLLKRFFTREVLEELKMKTTSYGATLLDCIDTGVDNLDLEIGVYALDAECYSVFADLFVPIIEQYHQIETTTMQPGVDNWGPITDFKDVDPQGEYVVSTGVKCYRNLKGYPFSGLMSKPDYDEIETKLSEALRLLPLQFEGQLQGTYHSLSGVPANVQTEFIAENYFKNGKRLVGAAAVAGRRRFWPAGRGVFYNQEKTFMLYVGEDDHVTIMSMQQGGNMGEVLKRLTLALQHFHHTMEFSTDERFGFLTHCPSNLGQAMQAYFEIRVPKLATDMPKLQEIAAKYDMKIKVEDPNMEGVIELHNSKGFGRTEYQSLKMMSLGITEIIEAEKSAPNVDVLQQ
ncbi:unnamed protein product [Ceutorhynchus assimilis]|uniref:arginine kinase n=1 Tax=Ceutorhynchus assimilis TaxID=467358 RepID=A0A9N9MDI8_9CUCU|nr:unnamed protein product [Ceutorhynchus assimilis]